MLILVSGSRTWTDRALLLAALLRVHDNTPDEPGRGVALMHGACPQGADRMAAEAAEAWGWQQLPKPADWDRYGRRAGPLRNQAMVDEAAEWKRSGTVVRVAVFVAPCTRPDCRRRGHHWTHGAEHCGKAAEKAGLDVEWVTA